jgi:hypothetical protein
MPTDPTHYRCPKCPNDPSGILQDSNGLYQCAANPDHKFVLRLADFETRRTPATPAAEVRLYEVTLGASYPAARN